ncbi:hypothetical protein AO072_11055 [Pseudomonas syringae ICMP 13102]|nr:hypothetical protein AO072_11055 [Pseudomonas syringae ICMP 13102]KTB84938.1 hypothetical protein AO069_06810 [Pseudomonas syringae pv. syringae PD2774]KWS09600.1 hypothetical protein AL064_16005 [Pseudomonas syringae pv. syringae]PHN20124.1 hypothetical protein AO256_13590 [Pseudomonas syringae]KWS15304.1 hypothetical protein AL063_00570 [Pseudomonas syringae pv. syringae]
MGEIQVFDSQGHQFGTTERTAVRQREHKPITNRRPGRDTQKVSPLLIRGDVGQLYQARYQPSHKA